MSPSGTLSTQPFRADDWWSSKAALLMGFVYLFGLWFHIPLTRFLPLSLFSLLAIAGFASFGYLVNDFFDMKKDMQAGKRNFLLGKHLIHQIGLSLASLTLIICPWFYLPVGTATYWLIGFQLSLFIIYSCPPVRLKERGLSGIVTDALYAHALPVTLAAYTFSLAAGFAPGCFAFILLFLWQMLSGMRNILIHQSEDLISDVHSGTRTFVQRVSLDGTLSILRIVVLTELLLCIAFFILLTIDLHSLGLCIAAILILCFQSTFWYVHLTKEDLPEPPLRYFPNNVYEKWLPVLYLVILSYQDTYFFILLFVHVTLFNFEVYRSLITLAYNGWHGLPLGRVQYGVWVPIRIFISRVVNHTIYYSFIVVGIDLKKENMSAREYFKKRRSGRVEK